MKKKILALTAFLSIFLISSIVSAIVQNQENSFSYNGDPLNPELAFDEDFNTYSNSRYILGGQENLYFVNYNIPNGVHDGKWEIKYSDPSSYAQVEGFCLDNGEWTNILISKDSDGRGHTEKVKVPSGCLDESNNQLQFKIRTFTSASAMFELYEEQMLWGSFPVEDAPKIPVTFNGEWTNGVTLYSDIMHIDTGTIVGKDTYPIRGERICETTYKTKTKKVCERVMINGKKKQVCHTETYQVPQTKCKRASTSSKYLCYNPSGDNTNSLKLENFKVSLDGGITWQDIPYEPGFFNNYEELLVVDADVQFKVDIPISCLPSYDINNAVFVKS